MACGCRQLEKKDERRATGGQPGATAWRTVCIEIANDEMPLACPLCLEKHVAQAHVYAREFSEDAGRVAERNLAIGNLGCAGEHARALGKFDLADKIDAARIALHERNETAPVEALFEELSGGTDAGRACLEAIGRMAASEEALRRAGAGDAADSIRALRLDFANAAPGGTDVERNETWKTSK